jgi:hypothetical protein
VSVQALIWTCEDCATPIGSRKRFCAPCIAEHRRARRKAAYERDRNDPERWAALLAEARERQRATTADPERAARRRAAQARWRAANRDKLRAANARYRASIYADPKRHADMLAKARIDYRLRQERKGRALKAIRKPAVDHTAIVPGNGHGPPRWAPLEPLADVLRQWAARNGAEWPRLARMTGLHEDELYVLAKGRRQFVHYHTADRVLVSLGSTLAAYYDLETLRPLRQGTT